MSDTPLLEITDSSPGYTRKRSGDGWEFYDGTTRIDDTDIITRIESLTIIPSWENVWICKHPQGYLQATGYDDAQRKQYLYHTQWKSYRSQKKLSHMLSFKKNLYTIRAQIEHDLASIEDHTFQSICALALWIIDHGKMRLGNWKYYDQYNTVGTITLKEDHVFEDFLKYQGKSSQERTIPIDQEWNEYLEYCFEAPGVTLLQYRDNGHWHPISASHVRDYLKDHCAKGTPKDFRTWWAEVLFISRYFFSQRDSQNQSKTDILNLVAKTLGHTSTVCKNFYITPTIYDSIEDIPFKTLGNLYAKSRSSKYCSREEQFTGKVLHHISLNTTL